MKNFTTICFGVLVCLFTACEETGSTTLELPFGGKIQDFQKTGITKTDLTSSLWFFENGCVFLVDDCDSFAIGSVEAIDGKLSFAPNSEWLDGDSCPSSEDLTDLLKNLSGIYSLSEKQVLTITTVEGNTISVQGSDAIIDPLCTVESRSK